MARDFQKIYISNTCFLIIAGAKSFVKACFKLFYTQFCIKPFQKRSQWIISLFQRVDFIFHLFLISYQILNLFCQCFVIFSKLFFTCFYTFRNKFFYKFSKSVLISSLVSFLIYIFSSMITTEHNIIASIIAFTVPFFFFFLNSIWFSIILYLSFN